VLLEEFWTTAVVWVFTWSLKGSMAASVKLSLRLLLYAQNTRPIKATKINTVPKPRNVPISIKITAYS